MLCEICGKHEANIKYTQIINGVKKQLNLCEECSKKLGIQEQFDFNMSMDLPTFLGEFLNGYTENFLNNFNDTKQLKCKECGMTYDEFANIGKFGCSNCYEVFSDKIDPILKKLHGVNRHIGRKLKNSNLKLNKKLVDKSTNKENVQIKEIENLKRELKEVIKQENYEEAAKIRDKIKELEKNE